MRMRLSGCLVISLLLLGGCQTTLWRAQMIKPESYQKLDAGAPFLKAHTHAGEVLVLEKWRVDEVGQTVSGRGIRYDADRREVAEGELSIPIGQVALLETNRPESVKTQQGLVVLGVVTGVSLVGTAVCLANTKACFGSCPTFYASDGERLVLQAEGFSSAVARTLEQTDVDALFTARPRGRELSLTMTNDALETHLVRSVRVLAAPQPAGGRVFRAGERFYPVRVLHPPLACESPQGSCLAAVATFDQSEYLSATDGQDLAAQEELLLRFPRPRGSLGLVLAARNSLLNTFLFYQTLAYMGLEASDWLVALEQSGERGRALLRESGRLIREVEISALTRGRGYVPMGAFDEVGPIATDVQLFVLPDDLPEDEVQIRLRMTRGNWKLQALALAELLPPVAPVPVEVARVFRGRDGKSAADPGALARLRDPDAHLVTYPGDVYTLTFDLPEGPQELFLESRGFYYEWIREQWLPEEDRDAVAELLTKPAAAFRRLAPAYKRIEGTMESIFWQSRIGR